MNLYKLHSNPEQLILSEPITEIDGFFQGYVALHQGAEDDSGLWHHEDDFWNHGYEEGIEQACEQNPKLIEILKPVVYRASLGTSPSIVFWFVMDIMKERWPAGEELLSSWDLDDRYYYTEYCKHFGIKPEDQI